ncbi:hypothetical protein B0H34DRAFT_735709 [Crassisporium funariophilum]|nr:hypothetical protein B0H34DRAFT_735709 [Crassisporium funariophilum]
MEYHVETATPYMNDDLEYMLSLSDYDYEPPSSSLLPTLYAEYFYATSPLSSGSSAQTLEQSDCTFTASSTNGSDYPPLDHALPIDVNDEDLRDAAAVERRNSLFSEDGETEGAVYNSVAQPPQASSSSASWAPQQVTFQATTDRLYETTGRTLKRKASDSELDGEPEEERAFGGIEKSTKAKGKERAVDPELLHCDLSTSTHGHQFIAWPTLGQKLIRFIDGLEPPSPSKVTFCFGECKIFYEQIMTHFDIGGGRLAIDVEGTHYLVLYAEAVAKIEQIIAFLKAVKTRVHVQELRHQGPTAFAPHSRPTHTASNETTAPSVTTVYPTVPNIESRQSHTAAYETIEFMEPHIGTITQKPKRKYRKRAKVDAQAAAELVSGPSPEVASTTSSGPAVRARGRPRGRGRGGRGGGTGLRNNTVIVDPAPGPQIAPSLHPTNFPTSTFPVAHTFGIMPHSPVDGLAATRLSEDQVYFDHSTAVPVSQNEPFFPENGGNIAHQGRYLDTPPSALPQGGGISYAETNTFEFGYSVDGQSNDYEFGQCWGPEIDNAPNNLHQTPIMYIQDGIPWQSGHTHDQTEVGQPSDITSATCSAEVLNAAVDLLISKEHKPRNVVEF